MIKNKRVFVLFSFLVLVFACSGFTAADFSQVSFPDSGSLTVMNSLGAACPVDTVKTNADGSSTASLKKPTDVKIFLGPDKTAKTSVSPVEWFKLTGTMKVEHNSISSYQVTKFHASLKPDLLVKMPAPLKKIANDRTPSAVQILNEPFLSASEVLQEFPPYITASEASLEVDTSIVFSPPGEPEQTVSIPDELFFIKFEVIPQKNELSWSLNEYNCYDNLAVRNALLAKGSQIRVVVKNADGEVDKFTFKSSYLNLLREEIKKLVLEEPKRKLPQLLAEAAPQSVAPTPVEPPTAPRNGLEAQLQKQQQARLVLDVTKITLHSESAQLESAQLLTASDLCKSNGVKLQPGDYLEIETAATGTAEFKSLNARQSQDKRSLLVDYALAQKPAPSAGDEIQIIIYPALYDENPDIFTALHDKDYASASVWKQKMAVKLGGAKVFYGSNAKPNKASPEANSGSGVLYERKGVYYAKNKNLKEFLSWDLVTVPKTAALLKPAVYAVSGSVNDYSQNRTFIDLNAIKTVDAKGTPVYAAPAKLTQVIISASKTARVGKYVFRLFSSRKDEIIVMHGEETPAVGEDLTDPNPRKLGEWKKFSDISGENGESVWGYLTQPADYKARNEYVLTLFFGEPGAAKPTKQPTQEVKESLNLGGVRLYGTPEACWQDVLCRNTALDADTKKAIVGNFVQKTPPNSFKPLCYQTYPYNPASGKFVAPADTLDDSKDLSGTKRYYVCTQIFVKSLQAACVPLADYFNVDNQNPSMCASKVKCQISGGSAANGAAASGSVVPSIPYTCGGSQ